MEVWVAREEGLWVAKRMGIMSGEWMSYNETQVSDQGCHDCYLKPARSCLLSCLSLVFPLLSLLSSPAVSRDR